MTATTLELESPALLVPWSARGLRHRLTPVPRGSLWRDQEGHLHHTGPVRDPYRLEVSGDDARPPALDGLRVGTALTVTLANELAVVLAGGVPGVTLDRDPAPDSVRAETDTGESHAVLAVTGREVTVAAHGDGPVVVFYRPVLSMRVVSWAAEWQEWDARTPWSLTLEEV